MTWQPKYKHRPCPCGCGELADECMKPSSGLNAFRVICWRSECRSGCHYGTACDQASNRADEIANGRI